MKQETRRTTRSMLTLALAAGAALSVSAIATATPQETVEATATETALPEARQLIDTFVKKSGYTKEALAKFKTQHATGTIEVLGMGLKGSFESFHAAPNQLRVNVDLAAMGQMNQGYDGKNAWMTHTMMGENVLEGVQAEQMRIEADYQAVLHLASEFETVETLERTTFEKMDCYKVRLVYKPYEVEGLDAEETLKYREVFEYYDVESGLLVGRDSMSNSDMGDAKVSTIMSDYKKFGEFQMASKTIIQQPGAEIALVIEAIEYNKLPENAFDLPESIKTLLMEEVEEEPVGSGN